ncbi:MAG: lysophospholipase L1-like esterase [Bradymonadia bacterium]
MALLGIYGCDDGDDGDDGAGGEGGAGGQAGERTLRTFGDSLLDFNNGQDVGDVAGAQLGLEVEHSAESGAMMLDGAIPDQYAAGGWLVVASGGGNDLGACCAATCAPVLDQLIASDATQGAIVELVEQAIADGRRVAWIGYMVPQPDAEEFSNCTDDLAVLAQRLTALDARLPEMVFIDGTQIGTGSEDALYAPDGYHPSTAGSDAIGRATAQRVAAEFVD